MRPPHLIMLGSVALLLVVACTAGANATTPQIQRPIVASLRSARLLQARSVTLPPATGRALAARMQALWRGIDAGQPRYAHGAFFPESAYDQLKHIANPSADYTGRLVADFDLDIEAAHRLISSIRAPAKLVRIEVDEAYAHWVPVGICYNALGYYEVPNSRVVYSQKGQIRSFGIASMISWDGQWFIVHLGSVLRPGAVGEVDDPELGPGRPAYSSTC